MTLIRDSRLPTPKVNVHLDVGDRLAERDFVWPELRLNVEVDGRQAHGTATGLRGRSPLDAELERRGWRVVRFSARQVTSEPRWVASVVTELTLGRRAWTIDA